MVDFIPYCCSFHTEIIEIGYYKLLFRECFLCLLNALQSHGWSFPAYTGQNIGTETVMFNVCTLMFYIYTSEYMSHVRLFLNERTEKENCLFQTDFRWLELCVVLNLNQF